MLWSFCFFVLFRLLWILVTVNKAKFLLRKTLLTFSKIPALGWMLVNKRIRLSLHHEKQWQHSHAHLYTRLLPPLLFSLKHITCHAFPHKVSNYNKYFSHNVFQCIWIKPHSSNLTSVENLTSNFRQSVHICCKEKENKKIMAIVKPFALHASAIKQLGQKLKYQN